MYNQCKPSGGIPTSFLKNLRYYDPVLNYDEGEVNSWYGVGDGHKRLSLSIVLSSNA